jgi:hypothetical protein
MALLSLLLLVQHWLLLFTAHTLLISSHLISSQSLIQSASLPYPPSIFHLPTSYPLPSPTLTNIANHTPPRHHPARDHLVAFRIHRGAREDRDEFPVVPVEDLRLVVFRFHEPQHRGWAGDGVVEWVGAGEFGDGGDDGGEDCGEV